MTKWEKVRLGEVAPIIQSDFEQNKEKYWLLNLDVIEPDTGEIHEFLYVEPSEIGNSTIKFDDKNVLYSKLRPYLNKVVLPQGCGFATSEILPLRPDHGRLIRDYLCSFLRSKNFVSYISSKVSGAKMPRVMMKEFRDYLIPLPPLDEQRRIAKTLDAAADLLRLRKQQLAELDALVKSRFIEMFGDPVTNPKGWEIANWQDVFDTTTGKLDSNAMVAQGEYPFFTCAKEIYWINDYAFDCEALLLAGNNAAGKYDVKYYCGKFNAYQRTYVLQLKKLNHKYELFKLQLEGKLLYLQQQSKGTNTRYLTLGVLNRLNFLIPPISLQNQFADFVQQVEASKALVQQSINDTQTLFDSLMSEYFE